jgi:large subunit ribosomal protein L29
VKGVRAKDLRGNDPEELRRTVRKLEEELFKNRLKQNTNQLENTMLIRTARRDIARVNTVLAERSRATGGAGAVPVAGEAPATPSTTKRAPKKKQTQGKEQET